MQTKGASPLKYLADVIEGQHVDTGAQDDIDGQELARTIGNAMLNGADTTELSRLMDVPSSQLSAAMRRDRRQLALLLMHGASSSLTQTSMKYHRMMVAVASELETRMLTRQGNLKAEFKEYKPKQLLDLVDYMTKWLAPIHKYLMQSPDLAPSPSQANKGVTNSTVNVLMNLAHATKPGRQRGRKIKVEPDALNDIEPEDAAIVKESDTDSRIDDEQFIREATTNPHPGGDSFSEPHQTLQPQPAEELLSDETQRPSEV